MKIYLLVVVGALGLCTAATMSPASSVAPARDEPMVPKGQYSAYLESVDAVDPSDVWAVGYKLPPCCDSSAEEALVKHWDGAQWRTIPSYVGSAALDSVAAISAKDVWAVGNYSPSGGEPGVVFVLHWDGASWSQVATPTYSGSQFLTNVSFTSPTNVVAHGYYYTGSEGPVTDICIVWHGSSWQNCTGAVTPVVAIDALSQRDAWGVGLTFDEVRDHAYAAHWNGRKWKETPTPDRGALTAVTTISSDDVWAAGQDPFNPRGFFEHWDGIRWSVVDDPHSGEFDELTGISGTAPDDVWASTHLTTDRTVIQHWDGKSWSDIDNPFTHVSSQVEDIIAISPTDAWAVGYYRTAEIWHRILMHWDGVGWSQTPRHHGPF